MTAPIEIVVTGGPCSGKTTGLAHLVDHLTGRGWRVLVVPEVASLVIGGGVGDIGHLAATDRGAYLAVQRRIVEMQTGLGNDFRRLARDFARDDQRVVVLHDRGVCDNAAYMDAEEFAGVLDQALGRTPTQVAADYDAVIHLVTAADGAAEHYTLANNEARTETPEQAVALDRAVQEAWLGHPHLSVITNPATGGFETKLTRLLAAVLGILGEPEPVEVERKWLLATPPSPDLLENAVPVDIVQHYLPDVAGPHGPVERRVRARTHGGHTVYLHTTKSPVPGTSSERIEHETRIGAETYHLLVTMADPDRVPVVKRRWCFVSDGQHFEADHVTSPVQAWLLEAELLTSNDEVTLPPGWDVAREVTDDFAWRNSSLAQGASR